MLKHAVITAEAMIVALLLAVSKGDFSECKNR